MIISYIDCFDSTEYRRDCGISATGDSIKEEGLMYDVQYWYQVKQSPHKDDCMNIPITDTLFEY